MVKLIVYDFDGVLTDNRVWVSQDGTESVACSRSDGWWIGEIRKLGLDQVILSTEKNPVVSARAQKLSLECIQGQADKKAALLELADRKRVPLEAICYVGNEMNDSECLRAVGFPMCPRDSHPGILGLARHVLPADGGHGVVRHLYDWLVARPEARR